MPDSLDHPVQLVDYDYASCRLCDLWKTSVAKEYGKSYRRSGIYGRGTGKNGLLFVGEAPGATEVLKGANFVGSSGKLLTAYLKDVQISEVDSYVLNTTRCRTVTATGVNRPPTVEEIRVCSSHHLTKDLPSPEWRPRLIVALGATAMRFLLNKQQLKERRGIFYDIEFLGSPTKLLPTFHPSKILKTTEAGIAFKQDLIKARQFLLGESVDSLPQIRRSYIRSQDNYRQWIDFFLGLPAEQEIECDVETTGLSFKKDKIVSISLVTQVDGHYYGCAFLTFPEVHSAKKNPPQEPYWYLDLSQKDSIDFRALKSVLECHRMAFQNGDFDTKMFWEEGILVENFFDDIDAHLMIDELPPHNLQAFCTDYLGETNGYKNAFRDSLGDKTKYHEAPPEILLEYNLDDTYKQAILKDRFRAEMVEEDMYDFYVNHAMPLRRSLTRMTYRGVLIDVPYLKYVADRYRGLAKEKQQEFFEAVGKKINDNSPAQLIKLLYKDLELPIIKTTKTGAPSTDKATLKELADLHPTPKLLLELRRFCKLASMLDGNDGIDRPDSKRTSNGLLGWVDEESRIHTSYLTHGPNSGRISSTSPNCFSSDTEVLTDRGWVFWDELMASDLVAQFDAETKNIDFAKPLLHIKKFYSGEMKHIFTEKQIDMLVTPEHNCLVQQRKSDRWYKIAAASYPEDVKQYTAGKFVGGNINIDQVKLIVIAALQADGYINPSGGIEWRFSKERKINRLRTALISLELSFSEKVDSQLQTRFYLGSYNVPGWLINKKVFDSWILQLDKDSFKFLAAEVMFWDGCLVRQSMYSSNIKKNADWVQILTCLTGRRAKIREYWNGNTNSSMNYQVDCSSNDYSLTTNRILESVPYEGFVYCVTMPKGTVIVRRNGRVAITGNCQNPPKTREFRDIFIAPPGWKFINADYVTAEMTLLGFLSGDTALQKACATGDVHSGTYRAIYHLPDDFQVPEDKRKVMKTINFLKSYGGGYTTLAKRLKLPIEEAKKWFKDTDAAFPQVILWKDYQYQQWLTEGVITSIFGRKRRFPIDDLKKQYGADSWIFNKNKSYFDRVSINFPCQSGVGDALNRTTFLMDQALEERYGWSPYICCSIPGAELTVHDELVIACPDELVDETSQLLKEIMTLPLPVVDKSLDVDLKIKQRWGEGLPETIDWDEEEDIEEVLQNG